MSVSVKLPDGRTITVATDDPQEAAKAARRLLARESIQKSGMGGGRTDRGAKPRGLADLVAGHGTPNMLEGIANGIDHFSDRAGSAATFGLTDVADAATNAGITAVKNLGMRATGHQPTYGAADAYAADRELLKERDADYAKKHPVASTIGSVLGTLGSPVNGPATSFVAKGAPKLAAKAGLFKGLLESTKLPAVAVRSGAAGAGMGAVAGATGADPGQELEGAKRGALAGGMTGAALPVAAAGAGRVLGAAKGAGTTIVRATNKATGGKLLDASTTAAKRLTEALKKDGATPEQLKSAMNSWLKTGASSPSLMDVAAKLPSGGANTMRLLTGSAMKGEAAGAAGKYADEVAASLPDNVINRARQLTPDTRPANAVADELKATQRSLADEQYKPAYETPVELTPDVASALRDEPGHAAVRRAIKGAVARRDYESAGRLQTLLGLDVPEIPQFSQDAMQRVRTAALKDAPTVTAGDLDRVRIAMGERGEGAMRGQTPARDVASGLFGRAGDIDAALSEIPEIAPARATYRGVQGQRDALDVGGSAMHAAPDDYAADLQRRLSMATEGENAHPVSEDDIRSAAAIGHRQAITDAVGSPAAGSTGVLNRLSSSPNLIRNQDVTFGADQAGDFRDAVGNEVSRLRNARAIDPRAGSQTAPRLDALADLEVPKPPSAGQMIMGLVNKVREGATLTDDERSAIVHLGLAKPEHFIDRWHVDPTPVLDAVKNAGILFAPSTSQATGRAAGQ